MNSEFPSCDETYATLIFYGEKIKANNISNELDLKADRIQECGEMRMRGKQKIPVSIGGWFYSTKNKVNSYDLEKHIRYLIGKAKKLPELNLIDLGIEEAKILCFWRSANGNGGPIFSAFTLAEIGRLGLNLDFDIWI